MNGLRVHLGEFLEGAWPTTLDGWDNKEADLEHLHPEAWSLSPKDAVKLFPDPSKSMIPHKVSVCLTVPQ